MDGIKKSFKELKWYEWLMIVIMVVIAARSMILSFTNPGLEANPTWLTIINFISAICGILCIFFCSKANMSNFIFAIINTVVYAIYLWYWKIYGTFFLEILFYMPMNFITWFYWNKNKDKELTYKTKSKKLTTKQHILIVVMIIISTLLVHFFLNTLAGNSWFKLAEKFSLSTKILTWIDASTFAIGIIATILELLRFKEQYVWWIITDIFAVLMYILMFDPVYLTKKSIYLIMAIIGLRNWKKLNEERNKENK